MNAKTIDTALGHLRDLREHISAALDDARRLQARQDKSFRLRWERAENGTDWRADVGGGWSVLACRRSPGAWYVVVEHTPSLARVVTRHVEGLPVAKRVARNLVACDLDALKRAVAHGMGER